MVPVLFHPAARTGIGPLGQRYFLPVTAGGTVLGRIGRIDLLELSTSILSFVRKKEEKLRPRRITDVSIQTSVGVHFVDVNVLHKDPSVLLHDPCRFLVSEVRTLKGHPFVNLRHDLFRLFPFRRSLCLKFQIPLFLREPLRGLFEKLRILNFCFIRQRSKSFNSHIDSHRKGIGGKNFFRNVFTGKSHPPFSGGGFQNGTGLYFSLDGTMENNRNDSGLRQPKTLPGQVASAVPLRKGQRGILTLSLEPEIARILSGFHSPEKGLKRQIDTNGDILERLGIDRFERRSGFFQGGKGSDLVIQGHSCSIELPSLSSMLQKMIVEPPTLFQLSIQKCFLFSGRIQPILECASHVV